jgi:hypothetical protein
MSRNRRSPPMNGGNETDDAFLQREIGGLKQLLHKVVT